MARSARSFWAALVLGCAAIVSCRFTASLDGYTTPDGADAAGAGGTGGSAGGAGVADTGAPDAGAGGTGSSESGTDAQEASSDSLASPDSADAAEGLDSASADALMDAGDADVALKDVGTADVALTYSAEVLADSPLAYFRLNDTALPIAKDSSGNQNDATYTGGVTLNASGALFGDNDTAVTLDGTSGYISAGSKFAFTGKAPFTLEAWIQPTVINSQYRGVMSNEAEPGIGKQGYVLYIQSDAGIGFDRYEAGVSTPLTAPTAVAATSSSWYHVVGVYDGSTMAIYVNATLVASGSTALSIQAATCVFAIGATHCGTTGFLKGSIDEVAVYGKALSASRIQVHHDVGSGK